METVAIVDCGSGNLKSAAKAFQRAALESGRGFSIDVTSDPTDVATFSQTGSGETAMVTQSGARDVSSISQSGASERPKTLRIW